jgi:biotin carboxyl carrier protein
MKMTVKIDGRFFEVEIADLRACPIVVMVEGERFEVWPEEPTALRAESLAALAEQKISPPLAAPRKATPAETPNPPSAPQARSDAKAIHAPIPGVIVSVEVKPGDAVEVGQELCVLEAMKMKNSIRAPRAGEIGAVSVSAGQHVQHHDLLFEYAD